jgi:hypothetical protein
MRFEIRINDVLGPLMMNAIEGVHARRIPRHTLVSLVLDDPGASPALLQRFHDLGVEVEQIRVRKV